MLRARRWGGGGGGCKGDAALWQKTLTFLDQKTMGRAKYYSN